MSIGFSDAPRRFSAVIARTFSIGPSPDSFQYDNLGGPEFIRLIELDSKARKSAEGYQLRTYFLKGAPDFYALSHSFEPQGRTESIVVNGRALAITPRLKTGLKELQKCKELRTWFWVDEICVNPDDPEEKANTVGIRPRIYEQAKKTVIWLTRGGVAEEGKSDLEYTLKVADLIYRVALTSNQLCAVETSRSGEQVRLPKHYAIKHNNELSRLNLPHVINPRWQRLVKLFEHPWFSAIWTLPEVALSKGDPFIVFRRELLPLYPVLWAGAFVYQNADIIRAAYDDSGVVRRGLSHAYSLLLFRSVRPSYHLQNLLWRTYDWDAEDPRDRFFALLELAADLPPLKSLPPLLQPDYTITSGDVARNFTRYGIENTKRLLLLALHEHEASALDESTGVPSWAYWPVKCKDHFGLRYEELGSESDPRIVTRSEHHASRNVEADMLPSDDLDCLTLGGLRVDTIAKRLQAPPSHPDLANNVWQWCEAAHRELVVTKEKLDFVTFIHQFVYTIDGPWNPYKAIEPWVDDVCVWLKHKIQAGDPRISPYLSQFLGDLESAYPGDRSTVFDVKYWLETWEKNIQTKMAQLCVTERGDMALAPYTVREGDVVAVLFGGEFPFALRVAGKRYRMVGECFMIPLNEGQAIDQMGKGELEKQYFTLV